VIKCKHDFKGVIVNKVAMMRCVKCGHTRTSFNNPMTVINTVEDTQKQIGCNQCYSHSSSGRCTLNNNAICGLSGFSGYSGSGISGYSGVSGLVT